MKESQRRPFSLVLKPPTQTHTHTQSLKSQGNHRDRPTQVFVDVTLPGNNPAAWLWQAEVSAPKCDASWGIVCATSYITHNPPRWRSCSQDCCLQLIPRLGKRACWEMQSRPSSVQFTHLLIFNYHSLQEQIHCICSSTHFFLPLPALPWSNPWPPFCR